MTTPHPLVARLEDLVDRLAQAGFSAAARSVGAFTEDLAALLDELGRDRERLDWLFGSENRSSNYIPGGGEAVTTADRPQPVPAPPITTPLEAIEAAEQAVGSVRTHSEACALIRALRSRCAPVAETGEVARLVERINKWIGDQHSTPQDRKEPLGDVLRDCRSTLADLERRLGKPAVDVEGLVDAVDEAMGTANMTPGEASLAAESAIRAFFARQPQAESEETK